MMAINDLNVFFNSVSFNSNVVVKALFEQVKLFPPMFEFLHLVLK